MNVKVVNSKAKSVRLYECDAVFCEKEGTDTIITPVQRFWIDEDHAELRAVGDFRIVLPRDGDTVYVENESGGTIDTIRAGEALPAGKKFDIQEGGQLAESESDPDRTRVFRGLPRGTGPEVLDVVGTESGSGSGKASLPVQRPPARG